MCSCWQGQKLKCYQEVFCRKCWNIPDIHDIYFSWQILLEFCTQSTTVTLSCSVQNFIRIAQSWKYSWGNEILRLVLDVFDGFAILWYLPAIIIAWIVTVCGPGDHSRSNDGESWTEILTAGHNLKCMLIYYGWGYTAQYSVEFIIRPAGTKLKGGILVSRHPSVPLSVCPCVCPSICGQNCVCSVSCAILAGSILYLHILSGNFRWCVTYNVFSKILKLVFLQIYWICKFVLFWLGIWYESTIWVIMGYRRVFSKCRHSSCCSWSILMFRFSSMLYHMCSCWQFQKLECYQEVICR